MEKMITTPSSLTNSTQSSIELLVTVTPPCKGGACGDRPAAVNPPEAGIAHKFRCSAILSLAISVGASSFWLAHQTQSAIAADLPPSETTSVEKIEKNPSLILSSVPILKHEVKPGETIWQLSQNYHIEPEAIAQVNNISVQTDLQVGQTIRIPTRENQSSPRPDKISSVELDHSLNNLKESRRKLEESLAALRSDQITEQQTLIAENPVSPQEESSDRVSDPISQIDESSSLAIELNRPIPIIVPIPDTDVTSSLPEPTLIQIPKSVEPSQSLAVEDHAEPIGEEQKVALQTPKLITPSQETVYQVQPGDTLNTIADSHGISVKSLTQANQITDPNLIKVHQSLLIPSNSEQSIFSNKLPPVPQVKPVTATPVTTTTQKFIVTANPMPQTATEKTQAVTIPVEESTQAPTEKLRADFAHLEQAETPTAPPQVSVSIPVDANLSETVTPEAIRDSEWDNTNRNSVIKRPQTDEARPTNNQSTIIGTASIQVEPYLDNLRIPVGTTVDPELPILNNPNQYLPETQPVFQGFIWPAKGVLTSGYGRRWGKMHRGIDIAAPVGTPVIAAAPGEVVSSGWNSGGYGNLVKVQHGDGSVTLYAHNSRLMVRRGQQIQQGQQIAAMGSTGFSTGPHLHFEVHPNGQGAVNPIAFLPKKERR